MVDEGVRRRAPGWVWRNLRGAVLVMGPDEQAMQLEGAAAVVWRAVDPPRDRSQILAVAGPALADAARPGDELVDEALAELEAAGALVVDRGAASGEPAAGGPT